MEENNQPNENLEPNKPEQEVNQAPETKPNNNFNVSSNEPPKKKGNGITALPIMIGIIVVAIVAGLIYYFAFFSKAEQMYKRIIGKAIDSYTDQIKEADYKTINASLKLSANIETDNKSIDKEILDLINKTDIKFNVQTNNEDKKMIANLESNYDQKSLLNLQLYSDINGQKTYLYAKDLLNKYIEAEMDDEFYSNASELLESQKISNEQKLALQKSMKILKEEITKTIKPEYCSSQKEEIEINGKKENTTKNTIKLNAKQLKEETTNIAKNLKDNEEFLKCFEDKETVKKTLEQLLESAEDIEDDEKTTIEVSLYTKGLMQELVKLSATAYSEEENQKVTIAFTKTEKNKYSFEIKEDEDKTVLSGVITIEEKGEKEGTAKIEFNIEEFGKVAINLDYSAKYNENIDNVNVKDSVKADKLTSADQKTLVTNLQKSKLYELIESFSGMNSVGTKNSNNTLLNQSTTTKDDDNNDNDDNDGNEEKEKTKENEIISYDDKYKITFKLPQGYNSRYVSENYRSLEKGDASIKISTTRSDKDKYYESLKQNLKTYTEEEKYKDLNLSEVQTMEVNGRKFYYATFSYTYASGSYETKYSAKYVWSEISDSYVVDLHIRGEKSVTEDELKEILTMNVEENK